jgi:hypothetical protein
MSETRCPVCGSEIEMGDHFCADCGARLLSSTEQEQREQQGAMASEERQDELDETREQHDPRVQTQQVGEEEQHDNSIQSTQSIQEDYSDIITVPFMNEDMERSIDLFLSNIEPLSQESHEDNLDDVSLSHEAIHYSDDATETHVLSPASHTVEAGGQRQAQGSPPVEGTNRQYSAEVTDEMQRIDSWRQYSDHWYGFALELPQPWRVYTQHAVTRVGPTLREELDAKHDWEHALVKIIYLPDPVSARDLAQSWVKMLRETWTTLDARIMTQQEALFFRVEGTLAQTRMQGMFSVQVYQQFALISGFQARTTRMRRVAPLFHKILASFHFIKKMRRRRYIDEDERAYTGYVPVDWSTQAHLRRVPTAERTPLVDFQALDATGTASIGIPPTYEVYSEDASISREDVVGHRKVMPATSFIEELLLPRYQARKAQLALENIRRYPERSQEANRKQGGTLFDVASVQYTYEEQGHRCREHILLQVMHTPVIATWTVQMIHRQHAPAEHFAEMQPFFTGILEARKTNEQWKQQERSRVEGRLREAQQNLASASASYIQAMYALTGSSHSIAEQLRASIGSMKKEEEQKQQDRIDMILHEEAIDSHKDLFYDLPNECQMYWQHVPEALAEEHENVAKG